MNTPPPPEITRLPTAELFAEVAGWLSTRHSVTLKAVGNSMYPFITGGKDEVVIQSCRPEQLQAGQIVLARLPAGAYVLHRILRIEGNQVTLMGDGNVKQTESCSRNCILGQVVQIIRQGRCTDCNSRRERAKAHLWHRLLPLRRYLLFTIRTLNKILP